MKLCLINPKGGNVSYLPLPHGLLQLKAVMKANGIDCDILNCNDNSIKYSIDSLNKYDVIGLSVMTPSLRHAVEIVDQLKPNIKVVWGGVHALFDPLSIVERYHDHYVISGEGEFPLVKLFEFFKGEKTKDWLSEQSGISFYDKRPVINPPFFMKDINVLPDINYYDLPNFERYLHQKISYFSDLEMLNLSILVSRGCSWNCSFCINSILRQHKGFHRTKTIEKIRRETEKIIDDFDIKMVSPTDEDFFANLNFVDKWKMYAKEKGFLWGANGRYNYFKETMINEDRLKDYVDNGLLVMSMGLEAGSEELRDKIINKKVSNDDIYKAIEIINNSVGRRLTINSGIIFDFPGDTQQNKIESIKWMDYLSKKINIIFTGPNIYRAYPGTKLYEKEPQHKLGDIDYYLQNIDESGTLKEKTGYKATFYTRGLGRLFSSRCSFFKLINEDHLSASNNKYIVLPPKRSIVNFLIFLPIRVRIRFNFWKFFIDPYLIGFVLTIFTQVRSKLPLNK